MKSPLKRFGVMVLTTIALLYSFEGSAQKLATTQRSIDQKVESGQLAQANSNISADYVNPTASDNVSPFDAVKGKKEDIRKRDAFSKHYINEDRSFTALIGAGPIHYEKNGQFLDIDHSISASSDFNYPFANTSNLFESYFGATSHSGVKNKTTEGEIKEFLNTKMYWEVNEQAVNTQNSANKSVRVEGKKAYYDNIYGNISAEFTILSGKRKLNYIIPNRQALGIIPAGADYLVFTEDVVLPFGWTSQITERGVMIKNQLGKEIYLYENPVSTEATSQVERQQNTLFEIIQLGNTLTIRTKVKTFWLLDSNRQFPVKVDPTVNVEANGGRSVYNDGFEETLGYFGRVGGYWLQYHVKFNTSSIPIGSTLNSIIGYRYQSGSAGTRHASSTWAWANSADPTTTSGTALYNSVTALQSTSVATNNTNNSWKSSTFTAAGRTYVSNNVNTLGYVALAVYPGGTWNNGQYYANNTHNSINTKPYLAIDYTAPAGPPSCATILAPANGATGIAHQGTIAWNVVSGATGYDVYFGASATPPLVSTNQAGTTYVITECLAPETTYYWRVIPKNSNGSATGCSIWSFTTDNKLHIYQNDFETANVGYFGTSGTSVDGWYTNNNTGTGGSATSGYNNTWTVGNGANAITGNSVGVSALLNGGLAGNYFQYWSDLGEIHRWIYRPFDLTGLRDIELTFKWKSGGEANQDYGSVISSINGGANWLMDDQGGINNDGRYWNSPNTIRTQTLVLPESRNNQSNFRLGFKWDDWSGNGYSLDPSFVVDDIVIKACPYEGEILSTDVDQGIYEWTPTGNTQTTLSIDGSHQCAQYQWEESVDDGVTWVNAVGGTGANTISYTTPSGLNSEIWYRCKVYFGTGCTGVYQEDPFKILFDDCSTETTWNGSSWSHNVPDGSDVKIIFEGNYDSNADPDYPAATGLMGCSVEVRGDAEVVIASGHSITIENEITVDNASGATFTVKSDANLLQINAGVENTGNVIVERSATVPSNQYNFWTSPVKEQLLYQIYPGILPGKVMRYNTQTNYFNAIPANSQSEFGKGYSIRGSSLSEHAPNVTAIFIGIPQNESTDPIENETPLSRVSQRFNLIGNPFPSNLDLQKLNTDVSNAGKIENSTFYFWDNTDNTAYNQQGNNYVNQNYANYNASADIGTAAPRFATGGKKPNGIVKPGQGFIVQATSNTTGGLVFTNEMRTKETKLDAGDDDAVYFKNGNKDAADDIYGSRPRNDKFWLELVNPADMHIQIAVGYFKQAENTFDIYDSKILSEGVSDNLYSLSKDAQKLSIQGRSGNFEDTDVIPLGVKFFINGIYKIQLEDTTGIFKAHQNIYLKDRYLNEIHNLSESPYDFEGTPGVFEDRFEIIFKDQSPLIDTLLSSANNNDVKINKKDYQIEIISSKDKILEVEIFNLSGWSVYKNEKVNSRSFHVPAALFGKQIIVVKVLTETGEIVTKKIINK